MPSPIYTNVKAKERTLNNQKAIIYFKKRKNDEQIKVQKYLDKKIFNIKLLLMEIIKTKNF